MVYDCKEMVKEVGGKRVIDGGLDLRLYRSD